MLSTYPTQSPLSNIILCITRLYDLLSFEYIINFGHILFEIDLLNTFYGRNDTQQFTLIKSVRPYGDFFICIIQ
jgi:hypothetical protein